VSKNWGALHTVKITYTSGTTGEPKGVCVGAKAIVDVVRSIALRTAVTADDRHLSVLPLTTLLENVGGLYVSLVSGATVVLLPQNQIGLRGASGIDTAQFIQQFERQQPTTTILIPQMVQLLVTLADLGTEVRHTLRFAAVGGAPISETLLQCALELGFPIYEGYGLSESTSVVAFNAPNENRVGSVGRPLPHIELKIAEDGEVWVRGSLFNGYLGGDATVLDESGYLPTGDLGTLDDAGFLTLKGRKKSLLTTAYGRNVAPEWVERELVVQPGILQAALFGNGKPSNLAVVVATAGTDVAQRVAEVNRSLPDYAQVGGWILADEAFTTGNGQWTGTARPRRAAIWAQYGARIEAHYQSKYKIESKRTHGEVV
jgi:long-subunit acyl-CoA synthetase (AMP-forming)